MRRQPRAARDMAQLSVEKFLGYVESSGLVETDALSKQLGLLREKHGGALPDAPSLQRLLQHWSPRMGGAIARAWGLSAPVIEALAGQRDQGAAAMGPLARVLATAATQASAELEGVPQADAA